MALPKLGTPKYVLTVPSSGKEIEYRPYTVREEKALLIAVESKDQKQMIMAVRDLIDECTFKAVDSMAMASFDFEYIFLKIRSRSVGEGSDLLFKCKECDGKNEYTVNLEEVEVQGEVKRNLKTQLSEDVGVILKYPTVKGASESVSEGKSQYDTTVDMIISCIDSIYDKDEVYPASEQSPAELREFVESFSSQQFKDVVELFNEMPMVRHDVEFDCVHCKTHNSIKLEGLQSFF